MTGWVGCRHRLTLKKNEILVPCPRVDSGNLRDPGKVLQNHQIEGVPKPCSNPDRGFIIDVSNCIQISFLLLILN